MHLSRQSDATPNPKVESKMQGGIKRCVLECARAKMQRGQVVERRGGLAGLFRVRPGFRPNHTDACPASPEAHKSPASVLQEMDIGEGLGDWGGQLLTHVFTSACFTSACFTSACFTSACIVVFCGNVQAHQPSLISIPNSIYVNLLSSSTLWQRVFVRNEKRLHKARQHAVLQGAFEPGTNFSCGSDETWGAL
jgi:hypothetical protein